MVNVKSKTCIHPDCKKQPTFNIEGVLNALYCSEHKLEGMVNIRSKQCIHPDCEIIASYNIEGETTKLYCNKHKLDGMIKLNTILCINPKCKVRASYNIKDQKNVLYCGKHKLDGMIEIHAKYCIYTNCQIRASYNMEGESDMLYCNMHKLFGMVNIKDKTCRNDWCSTLAKLPKYDGYCFYCYVNMFPDKPTSRNYKTKEYSVVDFVKTTYHDLSWKSDKKVENGCSRRRPDLLLDLGYQIIIVEIDERQHIDYDCSCENKRLMELSKDLGHTSIIFIRFNPDSYLNKGENISSCWGLDKKGICRIKNNKKEEWESRLSSLKLQIDYWLFPTNITDKTIEVIELFYDV